MYVFLSSLVESLSWSVSFAVDLAQLLLLYASEGAVVSALVCDCWWLLQERRRAEAALLFGRATSGSSTEMFDHVYNVNIFAEDDDFGRELDTDLSLKGLGADRGKDGATRAPFRSAQSNADDRLCRAASPLLAIIA